LLAVERQLKEKIDKGKKLSLIKSTTEKTAEAEQQKHKHKNNNFYISINHCHVSIKSIIKKKIMDLLKKGCIMEFSENRLVWKASARC